MEQILSVHSKKNDTICDMFMGSGTTGVACLNTNRTFIGIEMDEGYFNIAVQRINQVKKAQYA
jgi:site-specific DNA-methyltransferase (adenine-specific)